MIFHASCLGATIEDKEEKKEESKPRLSEKQLEAIKRSSEERHQAMGLKKYERNPK